MEFGADAQKPNGISYRCKKCTNLYASLWRKLNPEKCKQSKKKSEAKHPEKKKEAKRRYAKKYNKREVIIETDLEYYERKRKDRRKSNKKWRDKNPGK